MKKWSSFLGIAILAIAVSHSARAERILEWNPNPAPFVPGVHGRLVSGYDFNGPRTAAVLPPNQACALNATPETDACLAIGARSYFDSQCRVLCLKPIARRGWVAGWTHSGFRAGQVRSGFACPQILTQFGAKCDRAGGNVQRDYQCNEYCSVPVTP